jgi:parallel beta-helix repeat protein
VARNRAFATGRSGIVLVYSDRNLVSGNVVDYNVLNADRRLLFRTQPCHRQHLWVKTGALVFGDNDSNNNLT